MSSVKAKQYLKIDNLSILEKTVSHFVEADIFEKIIIPVAKGDKDIKLMNFYNYKNIYIVEGGKTRSHSVLNSWEKLN